MVKCINCNNEKAYNIADGLDLCPECEKTELFHLVQNNETKEIYWKNTNWCVCDETIVV